MDPFYGMEVGAEVEFNDGSSAVDHAPIKLENKQDLPLWQHLHYDDDSSSDESLDQQYINSIPSDVKPLEITSHTADIKSHVFENDQMEENIYILSTTESIESDLFCINEEEGDDHSPALSNAYSKNLQEQAIQLAPYFEKPDSSCTEVISSDVGQLQAYSTEVCTETALSSEKNLRVNSGMYSYFDARTQCKRLVNPLGRSYKCQLCGRQFGRMYNLENHLCIKVGCLQQNNNNIETMNRLEKMCAEAQKELQSLQGQYKKEVVDTQPSSSEIQTWLQEPISGSGRVIPGNKCTVPCDHQECESRSLSSSEVHISCDNTRSFDSQNLTALGDIIVVDLTNCGSIFPRANQEQDLARQLEGIHPQLDQINGECTNLDQHLVFQTSEENPVDTTKTSHEATKIYKCQECGKVYNTRCSLTNHMHYHNKKLISSVVNAIVEPLPGGQESYGTVHHVIPTQMSNKEKGQVSLLPIKMPKSDRGCTSAVEIFTCQYCGRVFNKRCAYVSHSRWHVKEQELQKRVLAEAQIVLMNEEDLKKCENKNMVDHDHIVFDVNTSKGVSDGCLDDGNVQGSCKLVRQLSLGEQHKLSSREQVGKKSEKPSYPPVPMQVETNQQTLPEVLESVLELVVGTEEVHEILLSKGGLVFRKAEDYGNAEEVLKDVAQVSETKLELEEKPVPEKQSEPEQKQVSAMKLEPAEEQVSGTQPEPAEEQVSGTQPEPADTQVTRMQPETADKQVSGTQQEPADKQVSGTQPEPREKQVSGTQLESSREKRVSEMPLEPAENQVPETQSQPAEKQHSLQSLASRLVAKHLRRSKPPHRCRDCGLHFHQFWRLKQHRLKAFGKSTLKKHQCDCGRTPIGSLHFLLHQLQHLNDTSFMCAVCSKSLRGYHQLQAHSWVHPLVSQFQCNCGTRFTSLPKYLWHSLKNKAKPKTKLQLKGCTGASV